MNQPHALNTTPPSPGLAESAEPSALAKIAAPSVTLAVWRRQLDARLSAWLDALSPEQLPHSRFTAARLELAERVEAACAGMPAAPEREALIADIVYLAERFAEIMAAPRLRIRLEAIEGDACRRFHQDAVEARLLCTYRGPATEWGYADPGETPQDVRSLGRGEAAICKGSAWRGAQEDHRLLHRSPPIAGAGLARLLLVVDPAEPTEDDEWAAARPSRNR